MRTAARTAAVAASLAGLSAAATTFDSSAKTNVVTYWGQGPNQGSLQSVCANPNVDVVNIGFVNVFPDQGTGGWPGTNFGNACGSETYTHNNVSTQLLSNCPDIGPDIMICQEIYGTKIFLSIGGSYPANGYIVDDDSAQNFAAFLWGAFGPSTSAWTDYGGPRPFGDAVVDGFDFDIESELSSAPVVDGTTLTNYKSNGYATMANYFKNTLFAEDTSKSYYLSAAPQCVVPDEHLGSVIAAAHFDFVWIQFYNTAQCSARQAITSGSFSGYTSWSSVSSANSDVKLYVGVPGAKAAASDDSYYLMPAGMKTIVNDVYSDSRFGGIMVWEATYASENIVCDRDYLTWMKQILEAKADGTTINASASPCPAQTVSKDGLCGTHNGQTCVGSTFGSCCSIYGYCGDSTTYCQLSTCDPNGGECGNDFIGVLANATTELNQTTTTANSTALVGTVPLGTAGSNTAVSASSYLPIITISPDAPYSNASANGLAGGAADAASVSTITSTIYTTITQTITTTNAVGDAAVYVTEFITYYTTIYPVSTTAPSTTTRTSASSTSGSSSTSDSTSTSQSASTTSAPTANANVAQQITKTIYTTEYFTVTIDDDAESQTTAVLTSSYAVGTQVYELSGSDSTLTSTVTLQSTVTQTLTTTLYPSSVVVIVAASSSSAAASSAATSSGAAATSSASVATSSTAAIATSSTAVSTAIVSTATVPVVVAPYALGNSTVVYQPTGTGTAAVILNQQAAVYTSAFVSVVTATIVPVAASSFAGKLEVSAGSAAATGFANFTSGYSNSTASQPAMAVFTGAAAQGISVEAGLALAVAVLVAVVAL